MNDRIKRALQAAKRILEHIKLVGEYDSDDDSDALLLEINAILEEEQ